ncbi:hypothetical protein [Spirulina sp. 06S082]|nr:hypothetical protein [Spirulina sp. 06S082]MEA5470463.1 hypothetical protein [Spirulina sp. 06S082]
MPSLRQTVAVCRKIAIEATKLRPTGTGKVRGEPIAGFGSRNEGVSY